MKWYLRSADAGEGAAMYNIGVLYEGGKGVPRDLDEARRWYRKAADAGVSPASEALKRLTAPAP